jgi:hypothetical protein
MTSFAENVFTSQLTVAVPQFLEGHFNIFHISQKLTVSVGGFTVCSTSIVGSVVCRLMAFFRGFSFPKKKYIIFCVLRCTPVLEGKF